MNSKWKFRAIILGALIALATTSTNVHGQILITDMALPTTVISVVPVKKNRCYMKNTLSRLGGGAVISAVLGNIAPTRSARAINGQDGVGKITLSVHHRW